VLQKLTIKNFKSFKDFTIEFDKFNCIVAPNNAGKSNLIEAFRFLQYATVDVKKAIEEFGGFDNIKNIFLDKNEIEFNIHFITKESRYKEIVLNLKLFENGDWEKRYSIENEIKSEFINRYFYTYSFYPEIIKTSIKGGKYLRYDGCNLVEVLNSIKEVFIEDFENISSSLIGIVEELNEIKIDKDLIDRNILLLKEKNRFLPFNIVSDGTINLLSILTAIYEPTKKFMINFDEIEKHLHLRAIDYILEILKSQEFQTTFTTQSSEILNSLDLKRDNLIFLYRDYEGFTKAISAKDIPNFNKKVKRYKDISTIIKNEVLGYLGDFDED
jgi:predicted ATPase